MKFQIQSMTCDDCTNAVTEAIRSVDPRAIVDVDVERHCVTVETTESRTTLAMALAEAGYPVD